MAQNEKMKDPAALFYIDTWLAATAEMDSDVRGWYLNLILHQFDKKSLPNNIEKLASLAMVTFSEFERFKEIWNNLLSGKFNVNEAGRLENPVAKEIIRKRERHVDEKTKAGRLGYFIKYANLKFNLSNDEIEYLKSNVDLSNVDLRDEQLLNLMVEHSLELFINGNGNENINKNGLENKDEHGVKNVPGEVDGNEPEDIDDIRDY